MATVNHHDVIDSTNKEAHRIVKACLYDDYQLKKGIVITANQQTDGIGRENRTWVSPPNGGLYYTLIIRPKILDVADIKTLSLDVAKVVQEVIQSHSSATPVLKWPNDLLLNNRKIGGILVDCISKASSPSPDLMILGIGVNLNQSFFTEDIEHIATSIYLETGEQVDKDSFTSSLTTSLIHWLGS